jgi:predicted metal-binding membrane protein
MDILDLHGLGNAAYVCWNGDGHHARHAELDRLGSRSRVFDVDGDDGRDDGSHRQPGGSAFAEINRRRNEQPGAFVSTAHFLLGYLTAWTGFSVLATLAQWGLLTADLLSSMMESTNKALGAGLLLIAGLFQSSRLKYACLAHCRSPMGFLATEWRPGSWGAFSMGLKHGGYCLGCCWALMGLLFVFGVMNLLWVAGLSAFVLLEKIIPGRQLVSRLSGFLFIGWAVWIVFGW